MSARPRRLAALVALAVALTAVSSGAAFAGSGGPSDVEVSAPAVFSPNGNGGFETWELSARLPSAADAVTLVVSSGQRVLRSWTAGSVAQVAFTWDGSDDHGASVPSGAYGWTIEAGSGGVVTARASGTVGVAKVAPYSRVTSDPLPVLTSSEGDPVLVRWGTSTAPQPGEQVTYEVVYRDFIWTDIEHGRYEKTDWAVADRTTVTSMRHHPNGGDGWMPKVAGYRVRTWDNVGNHGAWSDWALTDLVSNDRWMHATQLGFRQVSAPDAYDHGYSLSTKADQEFIFAMDGRTVIVVGLLCPSCGKARITVGNESRVVDTHRSTWQHRQILASFRGLRPTNHWVSVVNLGTAGHPYVGVDAIGGH